MAPVPAVSSHGSGEREVSVVARGIQGRDTALHVPTRKEDEDIAKWARAPSPTGERRRTLSRVPRVLRFYPPSDSGAVIAGIFWTPAFERCRSSRSSRSRRRS